MKNNYLNISFYFLSLKL